MGRKAKEDTYTVYKKESRSNIGYEKVDMVLKQGTHRYIVKLGERKPSHYLRKRIESQLKEKSVSELIDLSRQLT